jgi:hypothetical protein
MFKLSSKLLSLTFVSVIAATAMGSASAATWVQNHPRRVQVNSRLANQNARIHKEVKEGEITKAQAAKLHRQDHQIRMEERIMASQNGGHITKLEQRTLNQQENAVSRRIGS